MFTLPEHMSSTPLFSWFVLLDVDHSLFVLFFFGHCILLVLLFTGFDYHFVYSNFSSLRVTFGDLLEAISSFTHDHQNFYPFVHPIANLLSSYSVLFMFAGILYRAFLLLFFSSLWTFISRGDCNMEIVHRSCYSD